MKSISVVVATRNRLRLIQRCTAALARLDYPSAAYEIIIVDDGSTEDGYGTLERRLRGLAPNLRVLRLEHGGPARARNHGIAVAAGELVAFTDDDCEPDPRWLCEMESSASASEIGGVGGAVLSAKLDAYNRYLDLVGSFQPKIRHGVVQYLVTANACFPRQVLLEVGGFHEGYCVPGGEDVDLSFRVRARGRVLASNPGAVVVHHHRHTLHTFCRTFYNYGAGGARLCAHWGHPWYEGRPPGATDLLRSLNPLKVLSGARRVRRKGIGLLDSLRFSFLKRSAIFSYALGMRAGHRRLCAEAWAVSALRASPRRRASWQFPDRPSTRELHEGS